MNFLKSNTIQFNVVSGILWLLGVLSDASFIKDNPEWVAILAGLMAIINIVLRFKTTKPLSER